MPLLKPTNPPLSSGKNHRDSRRSVMASISLSFSSSLINNTSFPSTNLRPHHPKPSTFIHCAFAPPPPKTTTTSSSSSSSSSSSVAKKKHWKQGEFPGFSETSIYGTSKRKTPLKNVKKKLDRKNNAKAWANTVTETLSELIQKKQWLQALQV